MKRALFILIVLFTLTEVNLQAQHSVARKWNDALLDAIRVDFARPTVHARNLFHSSVAMYDAWAAYDETAETFLLGKKVRDFAAPFNGMPIPDDIQSAREEAMSYAVYRLLTHRFRFSPGAAKSLKGFDDLMAELGYDTQFTSMDYTSGSPAAFGNYIGRLLIEFGLQDGSNEQNNFGNEYYYPINGPMAPTIPGAGFIFDFNRWQPLTLDVFIDQGGNPVPFGSREFLGAEWGQVIPFSLQEEDLNIYQREENDYWVYLDPGAPPFTDVYNGGGLSDEYKWGFSLVAMWASHMDPADTTMWDISPASLGNVPVDKLPKSIQGYRDFYNRFDGGDASQGHSMNPHTGKPYEPQWVKRADYARVLAEFWADGPDSETPPGHWFTILNYVNDHPEFQKKFKGQGEVMDELEWDVKAYFILGGTMHDVAVCSWGIKGWYDYIRPISAIRSMAGWGQSSDTT
ncbi:MAG: hypothetical protein KDD99_26985, partial [Bacteroidetes bacterium]|nr:hypothetical protein [Bacteroidota bacterium]